MKIETSSTGITHHLDFNADAVLNFTPAGITIHNLDLLMSMLRVLFENVENIPGEEQAI